MKFVKCLLGLLFLCNAVYCQQFNKINDQELSPLYYLDSVLIDINTTYFNPDNIASINVVKDTNNIVAKRQGKIYITSKDKRAFNFLTIADIVAANRTDLKMPTLIMLDNEVLKDIAAIKIDSSYILDVIIVRGDDVEYLKDVSPTFSFLRILTKSEQNINNKYKLNTR